ncbi:MULTISPECIES: type I secretion system permease/ATPase [Rhodomicrobium]|uniref:type I secretion system permease/ATPase n=1 Tax=Rhodomicrobium TaxID=1068 RepID=UPI000B4AD093|nr:MULTISPECIES: type I secretion system permease/ATPase [Rhodomicrobium]
MHRDDSIRSGLLACRRGLLIAFGFSLALNLLMLTVPLYMISVYDRVLSSRSEETLLMLTIVAVGAIAAAALLDGVRQMILNRTGARLETALGGRVLTASLHAPHAGAADMQGLRDLAQVRQFITSPLAAGMFDAPMAPLFLIVVFLVHPHLGWLALGAACLIVLIALLNQHLTRAPLSDASRHAASALGKANAHLRNAEAIRSMGMLGHCTESWGADNTRALIASDAAGRHNAILNGFSQFLRLLLQIGMLGYGAYLVLNDHALSAGIIFAASLISGRALAPLNQAVSGWRSIVSARQAWRRLKAQLARAKEDDGPMALPAPQATLSADRLVYRPSPGAEPILKTLTFAIEPGDMLGIIGHSGAGKSTLARLLVGALAPNSGIVRIGGDDIANWPAEALGPFIGYVPQDVEMLPATVAQNIARMHGAPDPEAVVAAAKLANCHELIQRLPQGYDTPLGAQGHMLSGGQRQRIALARAFYGHPRIVVLDEPNASLDSEGEQALIAALRQAHAAGITCVVITQRASVVSALTKMMVLREGRIEAFGPKEEVLQSQIRPAGAVLPVPPVPAPMTARVKSHGMA